MGYFYCNISRHNRIYIFLIAVVFFGLCSVSSTYATTYYVDATNGNDANAGTSQEQAWKTIAKINTSSFTPGDTILFKRGEVWREALTVPSSGIEGSPITFSAYGTGEKPTINPSIDVDFTGEEFIAGDNNITTQQTMGYPGSIYYVRFTSPASGTANTINQFFGAFNTVPVSVKWAIYTDDNGTPGTLVPHSATPGQVITENAVNTYTYTGTKPVLEAYTTYYFAFLLSGRVNMIYRGYGGLGGAKTQPYANGFLDPMGTPTSTNGNTLFGGWLTLTRDAVQPDDNGVFMAQASQKPTIVYEDHVPIKLATSTACTDGNWFWDSHVLYYKPTVGDVSDHTISHNVDTTSNRNAINLSNRSHITIDSMRFVNAYTAIVSDEDTAPSNKISVTNNGFFFCGRGMTTSAKTIFHDIVIDRNDFYRCGLGVTLWAAEDPLGYNVGASMTHNQLIDTGTIDGTTTWNATLGTGWDHEGLTGQNFQNCHISDNLVSGGENIAFFIYNHSNAISSDNVIERNIVVNNHQTAFYLGGGPGNVMHNNKIVNNVAVNSGKLTRPYIIFLNQGENSTPTQQNFIANNTIYEGLMGVRFWLGSSHYYTVANNIFFNNTKENIYDQIGQEPSITYDYNLYSTVEENKFRIGNTFHTFPQWQSLGFDTHSIAPSDPLFLSPTQHNFQLTWNSPAIDSGTPIPSITTDINNNPIYGPPDIGAYEYQPPYTMGTDKIDQSANIRVYGDGKFRNTQQPQGTTVPLSIIPTSNDTHHYMDVTIDTWTDQKKQWTETSHTEQGNITHTITELHPDSPYRITTDIATNCTDNICTTDNNGTLTFTTQTHHNQKTTYTVEQTEITTFPIYRFYSQKYQAHFYTISKEEKQHIQNTYDTYTWNYEGIAYNALKHQQQHTSPIYRFYSQQYQKHFYTISEQEKQEIINNKYPEAKFHYEGIAWYANNTPTETTTPLYRFYSSKNAVHFYTISEQEKQYIITTYPTDIWNYEGIAWYGVR